MDDNNFVCNVISSDSSNFGNNTPDIAPTYGLTNDCTESIKVPNNSAELHFICTSRLNCNCVNN